MSAGNKVRARKVDLSTDYDTIALWWKKHGSYAPMRDHLPPIGIMVEKDREPICVGFLYNTDSKICVIEFIICDPEAEKELRDIALNHLIKTLRDIALELEYTAIYNSTGIKKFIGRLKEQGFKEADKNQTHMFYFAYDTIEDQENE
jgi:hypothetical protein